MTRLEEFGKMIEAIEAAERWDAYPEYLEKLCNWYEIDVRNTEKYAQPEDIFNAIVEAYISEGGTKWEED